jgi:hypothetical protein
MVSSKAQARMSERGGAGVKFLIVFAVLVLAANAGYHYVPVAYAGESFRSEMQTSVVNGMATNGKISPVDYVKVRLQKAIQDNNLPADTYVDVKQVGTTVQARAVYSQQVPVLPFGIYNYTYHFDNTAIPAGFLLKQ